MIVDMYKRIVAPRLFPKKESNLTNEDHLREQVLPAAPKGLYHAHFTENSTTSVNEAALTTALLKYAKDHGVRDASSLSVLGFDSGFHGTGKSAECPRAPFPKLKYPLAMNEQENRAEENRCLDAVRSIIKDGQGSGK